MTARWWHGTSRCSRGGGDGGGRSPPRPAQERGGRSARRCRRERAAGRGPLAGLPKAGGRQGNRGRARAIRVHREDERASACPGCASAGAGAAPSRRASTNRAFGRNASPADHAAPPSSRTSALHPPPVAPPAVCIRRPSIVRHCIRCPRTPGGRDSPGHRRPRAASGTARRGRAPEALPSRDRRSVRGPGPGELRLGEPAPRRPPRPGRRRARRAADRAARRRPRRSVAGRRCPRSDGRAVSDVGHRHAHGHGRPSSDQRELRDGVLVGANHELIRELSWRGEGGSSGDAALRFFDRRGSGASPPDIAPVATWPLTDALPRISRSPARGHRAARRLVRPSPARRPCGTRGHGGRLRKPGSEARLPLFRGSITRHMFVGFA